MVKRKVGSQSSSLTPDHEMSRIDLIPVHVGGVRHIVRKLSMITITLLETSSQSEVWALNYSPTKLWEFQPWQFQDSLLGVPRQKATWMQPSRKGVEYIIWGKVVASLESGPWWIVGVQSRLWFVLAPKVLQHSINQCVGWFDADSSE
jgi:hypothetical protein